MHLDGSVDDLGMAEAAVLERSASKHEHGPGTAFRVFIDPAISRRLAPATSHSHFGLAGGSTSSGHG